MKENIIRDKSFIFAVRIVNMARHLVEFKKEFILSKQILRSGTAIGALIIEAEQAESKKDFIHKMNIALKEANETDYWIELLYKTNYLETEAYKSISDDNKQLIKLLIRIIKTSKQNV